MALNKFSGIVLQCVGQLGEDYFRIILFNVDSRALLTKCFQDKHFSCQNIAGQKIIVRIISCSASNILKLIHIVFSDVPIQWLEEKLISLGLEVHTHGYKFTYPMNLLNNQTATGKNIYAVLRAPRAASTESMVLTTPLRPVESGLTGTAGSVSLMLSLAKHMKSKCVLSICLRSSCFTWMAPLSQ